MEPEDFKKFCNEIKNSVIISKNKVNSDIKRYKNMKRVLKKVVAKKFFFKGARIKIDDLAFKNLKMEFKQNIIKK